MEAPMPLPPAGRAGTDWATELGAITSGGIVKWQGKVTDDNQAADGQGKPSSGLYRWTTSTPRRIVQLKHPWIYSRYTEKSPKHLAYWSVAQPQRSSVFKFTNHFISRINADIKNQG